MDGVTETQVIQVGVEPLSPEMLEWRERQRGNDLALIANAAVSDGGEPSQAQREHAAMARRILSLEAEHEKERAADA